MQVEKDTVVTIDYTLKDEKGHVLESSEGKEPLSYIHGNGMLIPGLESALEGRDPGETVSVQVPPEEGYGTRDDKLVGKLERSHFQGVDNLQEGMYFKAKTNGGERLFHITDITGDEVTVDGNHPLAGYTLDFEVDIKGVRTATEEELKQQGPGSAGSSE